MLTKEETGRDDGAKAHEERLGGDTGLQAYPINWSNHGVDSMATEPGFEVDFLPVGNGGRSGDAIAIRYGIPGEYKVLVYDGGTKESGQALVNHIQQYYDTDFVDQVVNSHPDSDHASGLSVVLEELNVGELWMHRPWSHCREILHDFKDQRVTENSLADRLRESMATAWSLEEIASRRNVPIREPFSGSQLGEFIVLSPDHASYHQLIPGFAKSPEQKAEELAAMSKLDRVMEYLKEEAKKKAAQVRRWISAKWDDENLHEDVETSNENESSVILYGMQHRILLTGDAGIKALRAALTYAASQGIDLQECSVIQIPHHGSRHNVSPSILDDLVGKPLPEDNFEETKMAMVSAAKESETHPRSMVVNGFVRRGAKVIATKGVSISVYLNMPAKRGWSDAKKMEFSEKVEAWD